MAHRALDRFADSLLTRRTNRRHALTAAVAGTLGLATSGTALAQDATPEVADTTHPMFLFLQLAEMGTWFPSADDPDIYELTLTGIGSQTAFFSDRPQRIVGTVETDRFLEGLGFTPANPPNAAAVVRTPDGERDVLVIELFDPVYTREFDADGGGSLSYRARVLDAYHGDNLTSWYDEQEDPELPSQFDQVSLFIDDCPDLAWCIGAAEPGKSWVTGLRNYGPIPGGPYGACWSWETFDCRNPCAHSQQELADLCNNAFPGCQGTCNGEMG